MSEPEFVRQTRAAYDTVAASYADTLKGALAQQPYDRAVLDLFAELVTGSDGSEGRPVADVGCGPGRITAYLHERGVPAFGIDLSSQMVTVARQNHPELRFDQGSMLALDLPGGSLAGLVAWYSIIHTPPAELPSVLAEFRRVLAPGGRLLLAFQVGDDRVHLDHGYGLAFSLDAYRLVPDRVCEVLADAGFTVVMRLLREAVPIWAGGPVEKTPQAYLLAEGAE